MKRILVDQQQITKTLAEEVPQAPLQDGQTRLALESFALTANNVTYAASGFAIGYWKFFPTGVAGQGLVPVWGAARVVESRAAKVEVGSRLYGFYPMAEELVITPEVTAQGSVRDVADHRKELPAVYNVYSPIGETAPQDDHLRALLQPLLATSYLLADWLSDNDFFGAEQVIVGSASSKTGLGLCKYLAELPDPKTATIGLTSARNRDFVAGLGACDAVLTYDKIAAIPQLPSVYVDMAGNAQVKASLHAHLKDHLRHSAAVGISHWDRFDPGVALEGVKPQFFFAPAQITKRREDWGPGEIDRRVEEAFLRMARDASGWLDMKVHKGLAAALQVYGALAAGQAQPQEGHVIRLD